MRSLGAGHVSLGSLVLPRYLSGTFKSHMVLGGFSWWRAGAFVGRLSYTVVVSARALLRTSPPFSESEHNDIVLVTTWRTPDVPLGCNSVLRGRRMVKLCTDGSGGTSGSPSSSSTLLRDDVRTDNARKMHTHPPMTSLDYPHPRIPPRWHFFRAEAVRLQPQLLCQRASSWRQQDVLRLDGAFAWALWPHWRLTKVYSYGYKKL